MEPEIIEKPDARRYEIHVNGDPAGFVQYRRAEKEIAFLHTEIDARFSGQGLGSRLARYALDDAREHGNTVLPYCPYISRWLSKHPDYIDLVPQDQRAKFQL